MRQHSGTSRAQRRQRRGLPGRPRRTSVRRSVRGRPRPAERGAPRGARDQRLSSARGCGRPLRRSRAARRAVAVGRLKRARRIRRARPLPPALTAARLPREGPAPSSMDERERTRRRSLVEGRDASRRPRRSAAAPVRSPWRRGPPRCRRRDATSSRGGCVAPGRLRPPCRGRSGAGPPGAWRTRRQLEGIRVADPQREIDRPRVDSLIFAPIQRACHDGARPRSRRRRSTTRHTRLRLARGATAAGKALEGFGRVEPRAVL